MINISQLREEENSFGLRKASELAKKICTGEEIYFTEKHYGSKGRNYFEFVSYAKRNLSDHNRGLILGIEVYEKNAKIVSIDTFEPQTNYK